MVFIVPYWYIICIKGGAYAPYKQTTSWCVRVGCASLVVFIGLMFNYTPKDDVRI